MGFGRLALGVGSDESGISVKSDRSKTSSQTLLPKAKHWTPCAYLAGFLGALGVGMLHSFLAYLAGVALNAPGQPAQQKKYRRPL